MPTSVDKTQVAREAARGRSDRTPWLALGAVQLTIATVVLIVLVIVSLAYVLS